MSEKNIYLATGEGNTVPLVFKAVKFILISYVMSVILMAAVAAVVVYTNVPEHVMPLSVKVITFSGAFVSALLTCRHILSKGWLCGALTAFFHVLLLHVLSGLFVNTGFTAVFDAGEFTFSALCGFAGGIIGVNCNKN